MKLSESIAKHIYDVYKHHVFRGRNLDSVYSVLSGNFHKSDTRVLEEFEGMMLSPIDEDRDKVTLYWEDYEVPMVFVWKQATNGKDYVLMNVELEHA